MRVGDILELRVFMSGVLDIYSGMTKIVRIIQKKNGAYALIGVKYLDLKSKSSVTKSAVEKKPPKRSAKKYTESKKAKI